MMAYDYPRPNRNDRRLLVQIAAAGDSGVVIWDMMRKHQNGRPTLASRFSVILTSDRLEELGLIHERPPLPAKDGLTKLSRQEMRQVDEHRNAPCRITDLGRQTLIAPKHLEDMDMAELWNWLRDHPLYVAAEGDVPDFWHALPTCLDIEFVRVSGRSGRICKNQKLNDTVACWMEFGRLERPELAGGDDECLGRDDMRLGEPRATHDIRLDCGGRDFEDAFRKLCLKVLKYDGDYDRERT